MEASQVPTHDEVAAEGDAAPAVHEDEEDAAPAAPRNASCFFVRPRSGGTVVLPWRDGLTSWDAKLMVVERLGIPRESQFLTFRNCGALL